MQRVEALIMATRQIRRLLVNRGGIAIRIARTARTAHLVCWRVLRR